MAETVSSYYLNLAIRDKRNADTAVASAISALESARQAQTAAAEAVRKHIDLCREELNQIEEELLAAPVPVVASAPRAINVREGEAS